MKARLYIAALLMLLGMTARAQAPTKVGYTNVELILTYMPETKLIEKELETMETKLGEQLQVKQKYYQQKMMEYMEAKEKNLITPEMDAIAVKELGRLEQEIQTGLQAAQEKLLMRRMAMLKPLQDKIQAAIDGVAKEGGYTYILNNSVGSGVPSILYGADGVDVTVAIAKKLGVEVNK
jgi:outer membrane protein